LEDKGRQIIARAFKVTGNGSIMIGNLPTSDGGLVAGEIYADGTGDGATLKIKK